MTELSGYVLVETLREGGEFTLNRGWQHGNPLPVLVLTPVPEQPTPASLKQLEHKYSLAVELDAAWAARPLALARQDAFYEYNAATRAQHLGIPSVELSMKVSFKNGGEE